MKSLKTVIPSAEQLKIMRRVRPGPEIIRGAAGSGKTTTAVLKLKLLILWVLSRRKRENSAEPVRALILTFNRTLRGYISDLVTENIPNDNVEVTVDTFSHWAVNTLGKPNICEDHVLISLCQGASPQIGLPTSFLIDEVRYAMGRFLPQDLSDYLTKGRDGRGASPRVDRPARQQILDLIMNPFNQWKTGNNVLDWNDLAVQMASTRYHEYDIIIVDEAQDLSANQVRGVLAQSLPETASAFILDTAQRIYAGGFNWNEVGLIIRPENSHRLEVNYRNTPEIVRFASSLMDLVPLDDDGTAQQPRLPAGNRRPIVLEGFFNQQVEWCINHIKSSINLNDESIAFLHPKGWFSYLEGKLEKAGLDFIELTRRSEWPESNANIALSTLHSAKGLDFDHCIIIGLSSENLPEGDFTVGDDRFESASRLLSMAISRARLSVIMGYKAGEQPSIINNFDPSTFDKIIL